MNKIEIIGLGAGDLDQLPLGIYKKLCNLDKSVYVRTLDHPVVQALQAEGVSFHSFDTIYEEEEQFTNVYHRIVAIILEKAKIEQVIYAVPGHPMLAEKTVQILLDSECEVEIIGGSSYLDDLFTALKIDPIDGFQFLDATSFKRQDISYHNHLVFSQVYDQIIASEVKLTLLEDLPADYPITIIDAVGSAREKIVEVPLEELDRTVDVSNLTSVYVPPAPEHLLHHTFANLRQVIHTLRGPDGCPWDQKQTHESLREYAIEEVYELIDAIDQQDDEGIIEELGDVLLQVMLHSQIGEDEGYFTIDDVIRNLTEKMIHRHPHVFQNESVSNADEVVKNWEQLKKDEKGETRASALDGIAKHLPSLARAYQLQKRAAKVGFDWHSLQGAYDKLQEELEEFKVAIKKGNAHEQEKEFGDILFVLANIARYYKINPEVALHHTNEKFILRFSYMEQALKDRQRSIQEVTLEEMNELWEEAKEKE
ncbi:nucleoside triphosphate pyrophosphohydrolase [Virgibacillus dokdonensis]|uniref:Nucleoside triphosphate pyrophosphohydrolase/pyrophosphatase MazG n=1 Tax=Virgibacillus dokdonensis TaxID=302167 RepID=A0A2K9J092_9BACI|nr:nucleoside triphosphate pyrophosphohydrolase [Virgibacillus dokdonensis]AUJ24453.1 Nucleoside triphosphate pyrophosphohydrolase/pyrophosphatase MazG [Virgibacillus dokdonensis]